MKGGLDSGACFYEWGAKSIVRISAMNYRIGYVGCTRLIQSNYCLKYCRFCLGLGRFLAPDLILSQYMGAD